MEAFVMDDRLKRLVSQADDPNAAWDIVCQLAHQLHQSVEIVLEYEPPSEYAGRKIRLSYDADADRQSHEWLD